MMFRKMEFVRLATLIALFALISTVGSAQQGTTTASNSDQFTVEDSLGLRSLPWQSLAFSPDGRYVVYWLSYLGPESRHDGKHQEIWLVDTRTKQNSLITDEAWDCSQPTWSPDGKRVAFYDNAGSAIGIRVWSLETKRTRLIASDIERAPLMPWSSDSRFIYARRVSKVTGQTPAAMAKTEDSKDGITVYRAEEVKDKPPVLFASPDVESTILAFDVGTGAEKTVLRRSKLDYFALSPNGKYIAWYENLRFFVKPEYSLCDVGILTLSTGAAQIVSHDFKDLYGWEGNDLPWSPDGNTLGVASLPLTARGQSAVYSVVDASSGKTREVFNNDRPQDDRRESILQWVNEKQFIMKEGAKGRELWLVSIDGRRPYRIYESSSGNIRGVVLGAKRWDVWHPKPDTLAIFIRRHDNMKVVPVLVNYRTPSSSELPTLSRFTDPGALAHGMDSTGMAVVQFEDPTHSPDLYAMSADGSLQQLTHVNPQITDKKLGTVRLLEWPENGRPKRAVLLLPWDYVPGKRYPTIVTQYPSVLWSRQLFKFGLDGPDGINQQLYSSRGYAVLVPDIDMPVLPKRMGAEGEGQYLSERPNSIEAIANQVNTAVDYAVQQGYVDPDRLGITGISNGGYGVMCTIVSTSRFKAAIARAAMVDVITETWQFENGTGYWGPMWEEELGANLWKDRDLYISNSPFYFLDRVRTPLLLTRGTKDDVVTIQPQQAYIGLKQLGKDVTLVEYEGEGHGESEAYAHRKDVLARMLQFFDEYLK